MVNSESKRITYVDLFRAIGIIAMIMGHINFGWHFDHLIHGFHMPMFFFASGFFFKENEDATALATKVRSKCRTLLLPYFVFAVFHIMLTAALEKQFDFEWLRLLVFNTDKNGLPIAGALWFLTSLFFADVLYRFIDYYVGYGICMHWIAVFIGIVGIILGIYLPFRLPFGIDVSFVGLVFMHIGRIIHKHEKVMKVVNLNLSLSLALLVIGFILIMINPYVNLRWGQYGIVPVFWLSSVLTIVSLWNACRHVDKWVSAKHGLKNIYIYILNIGRDSIVYVCLNQLAILVSSCLFGLARLPVWPTKVCILLMTLILLEGLRRILSGSKLKILIGK